MLEIDNIRFESDNNLKVKLNYNIGDTKYIPEEFNEFVIIASQYNDFKIRVIFLEKPTTDDEFKILSRYYLINSQDRKILATNKIITKNNIYSNGVCCRKN